MKWLFLIAATAVLLGGMPSPNQDVAQLQPVQVLRVSQEGSKIKVETDTGEMGIGNTLDAAMENLKDTSGAEIFFDTADYLLVTPDAKGLIMELTEYLRPACGVCEDVDGAELEQVAAFLRVHRPEQTLADYRAGIGDLPVLRTEKGRMTVGF